MDKSIRGFLIDPEAKTIIQVVHNGDYKQIYNFIGADTFDVVQLDGVNCVYVDDEGLLNEPRYFFTVKGYHQPLAGKGLILGTNEEGDTVSSDMELEDVQKLVGFKELSLQGWDQIPEGTVTPPDHWMPGVPVVGSRPVFGPPKDDKNE